MQIRRIPLRAIAILAGGFGLVFVTGAWTFRNEREAISRPTMPLHTIRSRSSTTTVKTLATYWWNSGSCHGYPDVMQMYEVFRDENGTLIEYRDAGVTAGTDSCNIYHEATFFNNPNYTDCGGCNDENDGVVQGSTTGTTTGHPE